MKSKSLQRKRLKLYALMLCVTPNFAFAVTPDELTVMVKILERVESIPRPDNTASDFAKWSYDTSVNTLLSCTSNFYYPGIPSDLRKRIKQTADKPPLRTGSYSLPTDQERLTLCTTVAKNGFSPWCAEALAIGDRSNGSMGLPTNYILLDKYEQKPALQASMGCYLTALLINKQSFIPDNVIGTWVDHPRNQSFRVSHTGTNKQLFAGSLQIQLPHVPSWENKGFSKIYTAVILDK